MPVEHGHCVGWLSKSSRPQSMHNHRSEPSHLIDSCIAPLVRDLALIIRAISQPGAWPSTGFMCGAFLGSGLIPPQIGQQSLCSSHSSAWSRRTAGGRLPRLIPDPSRAGSPASCSCLRRVVGSPPPSKSSRHPSHTRRALWRYQARGKRSQRLQPRRFRGSFFRLVFHCVGCVNPPQFAPSDLPCCHLVSGF